MIFTDFLRWAFRLNGGTVSLSGSDLALAFEKAASETCVRELAFWTAANLIANTLSKCEFKVYEKGEEKKSAEWYLWNVEPNQNQNSSEFLRKIVTTLLSHDECLVIEQAGKLYVADSFSRKEYALYPDVFSQVTVMDFTFNRQFSSNEVLYWRLSDGNVSRIIDAIGRSYQSMMSIGMQAYQRKRGSKATFSYDTIPAKPPEMEGDTAKFQSGWLTAQIKSFRAFLEATNGVAPIGKGYGLTPYDEKTPVENSRDIRAMADDIFDFTAKGLLIPPVLLKGDVAGVDSAMTLFLTTCIDSWADFLREEIVRKRIGYKGLQQGYDLVIDTKQVKHVDLLSVSEAIDKLIASGAFCINDIRKLVGEPIIDEPWAWAHFITKNYELVADALKRLSGKGGETQ